MPGCSPQSRSTPWCEGAMGTGSLLRTLWTVRCLVTSATIMAVTLNLSAWGWGGGVGVWGWLWGSGAAGVWGDCGLVGGWGLGGGMRCGLVTCVAPPPSVPSNSATVSILRDSSLASFLSTLFPAPLCSYSCAFVNRLQGARRSLMAARYLPSTCPIGN